MKYSYPHYPQPELVSFRQLVDHNAREWPNQIAFQFQKSGKILVLNSIFLGSVYHMQSSMWNLHQTIKDIIISRLTCTLQNWIQRIIGEALSYGSGMIRIIIISFLTVLTVCEWIAKAA